MRIPNISNDISNIMEEQTPPRGADKMVRLLQQAKMNKAQGNQEAWNHSLKEFEIATKGAKLAQEEKHLKEVDGLKKKLDDALKKYDELDLNTKKFEHEKSQDLRSNMIDDEIAKYVKAGNYRAAYRLMLAYGRGDEDQLRRMAMLVIPEVIKNPRVVAWLEARGYSELSDKEKAVLVYEQVMKPEMQAMDAPKELTEIKPKVTGSPAQDMAGLDLGIPQPKNMESKSIMDYQGRLDSEFPMPEQGLSLPKTEQTQTQQTSGWTSEDLANYLQTIGEDVDPITQLDALIDKGHITEDMAIEAAQEILGIRKEPTEEATTDRIAEAKFMMEQGATSEEILEWFRTASPTATSNAEWENRTYNEIMNNESLPMADRMRLAGYLFGNKDTSGSTSRASDPDPNVALLPDEWKQAYSLRKTGDQTTFGKSGNTTLVNRIVEISNNENLSEEEKNNQTYALFKEAIVRDERSSSKTQEMDGYRNLVDMADIMESHLEAHPSGADPQAPGFWQNALLKLTKSVGLTFQDELSQVNTINDLSSVLFIKAISGAAVTDKERAFLQGILTRVKDGHALNRATIQGMRNFVGRRLYGYYKEKMGSHAHGVGMTEYLMGGILPSGNFTTDGSFIETPNKPFSMPKPTGRLSPVEGMRPTQPVKAVPDKDIKEFQDRWTGFDKSQKKQAIDNLIKSVGEREARAILKQHEVPEDELSDLFGEE